MFLWEGNRASIQGAAILLACSCVDVVNAGYRSIANPNVSEEAKVAAAEKLKEMGA